MSNIYNSNGACFTECQYDYAFAVVQDELCWCSNYIPQSQVSVADCDVQCPGYPSEDCGNKASDYYGYVALSRAPAGTAGGYSPSSYPASQVSISIQSYPSDLSSVSSVPPAPQSSAPNTSPSSTSVVYSVVVVTSLVVSRSTPIATSQPTPLVRTSLLTPSSLQSYTAPKTVTTIIPDPRTSYISRTISVVQTVTQSASVSVKTKVSKSTITQSAVVSVEVVTVSGADHTQTVTSTPVVVSGGSSTDPDPVQVHPKSGVSGGAIAGIVIGVLAAVALIAGAAFLFWRRRRDEQDAEDADGIAGGAKKSPRRNVSVLSKTGLLSRARHSIGEKDHEEPNPYVLPPPTGNNSGRQSMLFGGLGGIGEGISPISPLGGSQDGEGRRNSKPLFFDQRLNPSALFANHDNSSRVSMQDQNDYSRPLGVVNPDIRNSFESRT